MSGCGLEGKLIERPCKLDFVLKGEEAAISFFLRKKKTSLEMNVELSLLFCNGIFSIYIIGVRRHKESHINEAN